MKMASFKEWRKLGLSALDVGAFLAPIIWTPILIYRKNYVAAFWCTMTLLFMFVVSLLDRMSKGWKENAEYWKREAEQWRRFDERINALEPGQRLVIEKGGDKARNYRIM